MDVMRRYVRNEIGAGAASALYRAYRMQDDKLRGLQVLGEIAREYPSTDLGMWATYYKSSIENNWQERAGSLQELRKSYYQREQ